MNYLKKILILCALIYSGSVFSESLDSSFDEFASVYTAELGSIQGCETINESVFRVCSDALKNEGNAPYILHHGKATEKVVVFFHGLSDSPFFFLTIAQAAFSKGNNVVVALLPGHGKKDADQDMQDPNLAKRWSSHVNEIMEISASLGESVYIGGFSTGGALATQYVLNNPGKTKGLLLFSGALALDEKVETMAKIWGMKWLAKLLDGDYPSIGRNPYKYPSVAMYAAFQLTDVIFDVRALLDKQGGINIPIFSAHSLYDTTTPIRGVKSLIAVNKADSELFSIPEDLQVCHASVVVSAEQLVDMNYDATGQTIENPCDVPGANPLHERMLTEMLLFLWSHK